MLLGANGAGKAADGVSAPVPAPATAQPGPAAAALTARTEDHSNFGRLDFTADAQVRYRIERDGDRVSIRFDAGTRLGPLDRLPRNVQAAKVNGASLDLTLAHGASVHPQRTGGHIVFDVLDGPGGSKPQPVPETPRIDTAPRGPVTRDIANQGPAPKLAPSGLAGSPELGGRVAKAPVPPPPAQTAPEPAPKLASAAPDPASPKDDARQVPLSTDEKSPTIGRDTLPGSDEPAGLVARRVRLPPEIEGSAVLLPFDAGAGAAAFRSGDQTHIVFDQRRSVSLSLLQEDPVFRGMTVRVLPTGTSFQLQLPPNQNLALALVPQGWRLMAIPATPRRQSIPVLPEKGHLELPADQPGSVISIADPDSGATLLVGTQRRPGQAIAIQRRTGQYILRQAIQGVVVEPLADSIQMQTTQSGFSLSSSAGPLAVSPITASMQASIAAAPLTRVLDLPMLRPETMLRRLERQFLEAGATPPLSRGPVHRAAAESLVSLGFAAEADSLLRTVAAQDPQEANRPATEMLMGVTALLAGRPNDADALNDPRLDGTDEIDFWRAMRKAMADEGSPAAAAVFAATGPLVTAYPKPIAEHLLPLVVETMLLGGELAPAARLMDARPNDPKLAYARALRRQADGDTDGALAMLDQLTLGRDQFDRLRGAVHAVELRLKTGRIDTVQAADALDKLLIAWRGDERELALRERVADLRARTGAWRAGLTMLRDAERDFPERQADIRGRLQDMFNAMMRDDGTRHLGAPPIPPLDFVAMVDENLDLMPRFDNDPTVQQALLDRLIALDLPDRAIPLLSRLLRGATTDIAKARYGATLAAMQNHEGQAAEALATLDATETDKAPDDLAEGRILTRASAMAHGGDRAGGIKLLNRLATARAAAQRATMQEEIGDFQAAALAWRDALEASALPASGPISAGAAHIVLRLAAAIARTGDDAGLQALGSAWLNRLPAGADADAFRLLTAAPVRTAEDLRRSAQEMGLAASLAADGRAARPVTR